MTSPDPPSHSKEHPSDYYYFVVVVAVVAVLLLASNMLVVGCCSRCSLVVAVKRFLRSRGILPGPSEDDVDPISRLIPSCRYGRERGGAAAESECPVCLAAFAEGDEVRQMPACKHSFHAPCIDMWLYSHSNCPMCRADVLPKASQGRRATAGEEAGQSRMSLMAPGGMTGVVVSML